MIFGTQVKISCCHFTNVYANAYINPLIAVVLGVLVLNEPLNTRMVVAAGAVLIGMLLVRKQRR